MKLGGSLHRLRNGEVSYHEESSLLLDWLWGGGLVISVAAVLGFALMFYLINAPESVYGNDQVASALLNGVFFGAIFGPFLGSIVIIAVFNHWSKQGQRKRQECSKHTLP